MKVAIVNLTGGGLSGGYQKYLAHLVPALSEAGVERTDLFVPPSAFDTLRARFPLARSWPRDDHRRGYRELCRELRSLRPDVIFIPTARHLQCDDVPTVVMVRNMEPLAFPFIGAVVGEGIRNVGRAAAAFLACRAATRVIAVSEYVKSFVVRRFGIGEDKIAVVPHGVDPPQPRSALARPATVPSALSDFLFTAGSIRPARGLEDAIAALGLLRARGIEAALVIAGKEDPGMGFYRARLERLAARAGVASQVVWAGQLSPAEMSWCLSSCATFVMTSRVEACPNMVLEAMSHGCLSVSGDNEPMPEFFGDGCIYYPTGNAAALATRLLDVRGAAAVAREEVRAVARERAHRFTWDRTATRTIQELRTACRGGARSAEAIC